MAIRSEASEEKPDLSKTGYAAGDQVMADSPWVWALDPQNSGLHCEHCFKRFDMVPPVKCRACQRVTYCSLSCLVASYKQLHRFECAFLNAASPQTLRNMTRRNRCLLLALLLAEEQGDDKKKVLSEASIPGRTWKRLLSHWSEFKKRPDVVLAVRQLLQFIRGFVGEVEFEKRRDGVLGFDNVGEAFGKFAINSFTVTDDDFNELGCGIYLAGSVFDHSCWPNASKHFVGKDLYVYATRSVRSIEEVTIAYKFMYQRPAARRAELKNQYFFDCMCDVCGSSNKVLRQERLLDGQLVDGHCHYAVEEASRKAGEALMTLAGAMNLLDKRKLKGIVKSTASTALEACDTLSVTNAEVNEYLDRCGFLMDTLLNQPRIAAVMYELTVVGYRKIFPEGSFELLVQLRRWLDCAIKSNKGLTRKKDWTKTSKRAIVAYVTSVRPYLNHRPKLRCDEQINWKTLLGLSEEILRIDPMFCCWIDDEKELTGQLKNSIRDL